MWKYHCLNDLGIVVNQTAKNNHVREIERESCTLKERVQAVWNTFLFKLTNDMIVILAYACKMMFPKVNSSAVISPTKLSPGVRVDYKRTPRFGEYVHVRSDNDITNTTQPQTYGAISLEP